MIKKWKILESKKIFSSHFITLKEEKLKRPDGKLVSPYYAIERPDVVYIVALTNSNEIILVSQYKNGVKEVIWEIPAGFLDKGESAEDAAKRELLEETGYSSENFVNLGGFNSGSGLTRNINNFFLAKKAVKITEQSLDENEEIEVKTFPFRKVLGDVKDGKGLLPEVQSQLGVLLAERYI